MGILSMLNDTTAKTSEETIDPRAAMKGIWLKDLKNTLAIRRLKLAEGLGVPISLLQDTPANVTIQQHSEKPGNGLKSAAVASIITLLGGGLLTSLFLLNQKEENKDIQKETITITPKTANIQIRYKMGPNGNWLVQQQDGSWKEIE